jgi:hypothetical protein
VFRLHRRRRSTCVRGCVTRRAPNITAIALDTPGIARHRAPGYPVDLLVQDHVPQWVEEMNVDAFRRFFSRSMVEVLELKYWSWRPRDGYPTSWVRLLQLDYRLIDPTRENAQGR